MEQLIKLIEKEEGWIASPYYCSEGYPTVGYGFKIGLKDASLPQFTLPKAAGKVWLRVLLKDLEEYFESKDWFDQLTPARRAIIISMAYQMGISGVLKFKKMIKALEAQDYITASNEMLQSRWASQTPGRANRHAMQLQGGFWHSYYS